MSLPYYFNKKLQNYKKCQVYCEKLDLCVTLKTYLLHQSLNLKHTTFTLFAFTVYDFI